MTPYAGANDITPLPFEGESESLIAALDRIHAATVGDAPRNSAAVPVTHATHMRQVAYRTLTLGGKAIDFITGYLHDVIEEDRKNQGPGAVCELIESQLKGDLRAHQIRDVIERIELLTEDSLTEAERNENLPEVDRYLKAVPSQLNENLPGELTNFLGKYFRKYRKFLIKLQGEYERVRLVELADRWDGLLDMSYLRKFPVTQRHISLGRMLATLQVMKGEEFPVVMNAYETAYKEWELNEILIQDAAGLFLS